MVFGVFQSILQHGSVHNVELNMVPTLIEITSDKCRGFVKVLPRLEALGIDFDVRPLGKASHQPWKPIDTIADIDTNPITQLREFELSRLPYVIEHLNFVLILGDSSRFGVRRELRDELVVMRRCG